jgi:hypothetical protein
MGNHDTFSLLALHWIAGLDLSSCSHELHDIRYISGNNIIFFTTNCCECLFIGVISMLCIRAVSDYYRLRNRLVSEQ